MKIKFGNLSVSQLSRICETMHNCAECPFQNVCAEEPYGYLTDEYVEIDLPDENNRDCCENLNKNLNGRKVTDKFDSIINDLKNGVQPQIATNSQLPDGCREV